jgi:ribosomal protein S18 acetylase RimI-like enzyme
MRVMVSVRSATSHDEHFLWTVLAMAADWRPGTQVRSAAEVMTDPGVAHYLHGWPRDGDFGVIAHDEGSPVGGAWCRHFPHEPRGYGYVADDIPELTIGVITQRRGEGIGRHLLGHITQEARRRGIARISLSVEADNPALHLYPTFGFTEINRTANSPTMVLTTDGLR